jgi:hypothetical protein
MFFRTRRFATWAIGLGLVGLGVAVTVDALTDRGPSLAMPDGGTVSSPSTNVHTTALPECTRDQLELAIDLVGGTPTVVLRHVRGPSCRLTRTRAVLTVRDRRGRKVPVVEGISPFSGDFGPQTETIAGVTYLARCNQVGPLTAVVRAGAWSARRGGLPIEGCIRKNGESIG